MDNQKKSDKKKVFVQRLDFYWKFLSIYAIVFILYALLKGTIDDGNISIILKDPILILFAVFIIISALGLLLNWYKQRTIIIDNDSITFKSRFREKKYLDKEIIRIAFGRIKASQSRSRKSYRVIKIKAPNRRRVIKIRPMSFWDDKDLTKELMRIKKSLK